MHQQLQWHEGAIIVRDYALQYTLPYAANCSNKTYVASAVGCSGLLLPSTARGLTCCSWQDFGSTKQ